MTICISAIATEKIDGVNKEIIVISTDHMVTNPLGEFEQEIKKYRVLNKGVIVMLSGRILLFNRLLEKVNEFHNYNKIKTEIYENFKKVRKEEVKKEAYEPIGIEEEFVRNLLINPLQNDIAKKILENAYGHSLKTNILLSGFDDEKKAQICEIGEKDCLDLRELHFHTIGSGWDQAYNTLLFQGQCRTKNLKTTIYNVFKAKKNAEAKQGVGKETEIIICDGERVYEIGEEDMENLKKVHERDKQFGVEEFNKESLKSPLPFNLGIKKGGENDI